MSDLTSTNSPTEPHREPPMSETTTTPTPQWVYERGFFKCPACGRVLMVRDVDDATEAMKSHTCATTTQGPCGAEYVRNGVCLLCGGAVLTSGEHIDPGRHVVEVERITSARPAPVVNAADVERAAAVLLADYQQQYDGGQIEEFLDLARAVARALGLTVADEGRAEA